MARAIFRANELPIPEKLQAITEVVSRMGADSSFPAPRPSLRVISEAAAQLSEKYDAARAARAAAKSLTHDQRALEKGLDGLISLLVVYVNAASQGSEAKIAALGLEVKKEPVKPVLLPAPKMKSAQVGAVSGTARLSWNPVQGAKSYVIEHTADPSGSAGWTNGADFTQSRGVVGGLTPGGKFLFRVAAVNAKGKGPWSQVVTQLAAL